MFEVEILRNIRESFGGDEALVFWQTVTHLGDAGLVWIALGLFLLCFPGFRRIGSTIGIALFSGFLICNVLLKPMVDRLRPCELHAEDLLMACPTDPSFPSDHTTASFAAAVAFGIFHPKWGLGLLTLAVLIAWSRLYLFVHWPSDVAVGILVGTISAAAAAAFTKSVFAPHRLHPNAVQFQPNKPQMHIVKATTYVCPHFLHVMTEVEFLCCVRAAYAARSFEKRLGF